ncbi:MAG: hypothetical protein DMG27_20550 [Acidobacteria bacterium]|nr:MAG: hypothetical protein DMG27_20550 [Acidobacteriota bacterium]
MCGAIQMNRTRLGVIAVCVALGGGALLLLQAHQSREKRQLPVRIDLSGVGRPGESTVISRVDEVKRLPQAVRNKFGGLADPGDSFQSTDVIRGKHLPIRRLVLAGVSEKYCILVAVFELSKDQANIIWLSDTRRMAELQEVKTALESGKLINDVGRIAW